MVWNDFLVPALQAAGYTVEENKVLQGTAATPPPSDSLEDWDLAWYNDDNEEIGGAELSCIGPAQTPNGLPRILLRIDVFSHAQEIFGID